MPTVGIVVTGTSRNHLREAMGFIASAQSHTPNTWPIAVYDLGGIQPEHTAWLCRVQLPVPYSSLPSSVALAR